MASKKQPPLLPCPLCGTEAKVTRLQHGGGHPINTYNVSCGVRDDDSDTCGLVLFGGDDNRKAMVEKWNKRAI